MACHICKRDGTRTCNQEEAEIKCMLCGRCEAERAKAAESDDHE